MKSILVKNQKQTHTIENIRIPDEKLPCDLVVNLRYDDQCGNGYNNFGITGELYYAGHRCDCDLIACGCVHDLIQRYAPKFAKYIKWHGVGSNGPSYYISTALYHTSDRDVHGLKAGEYSRYQMQVLAYIAQDRKPTVVYKSDIMYTNAEHNPNLRKHNAVELGKTNKFYNTLKAEVDAQVVKEWDESSLSEGKVPDISAARNCAVWHDATLEELRDKDKLEARLPALIEDFRDAMEELGFTF